MTSKVTEIGFPAEATGMMPSVLSVLICGPGTKRTLRFCMTSRVFSMTWLSAEKIGEEQVDAVPIDDKAAGIVRVSAIEDRSAMARMPGEIRCDK